jgi:hypothetical protein
VEGAEAVYEDRAAAEVGYGARGYSGGEEPPR